MMEWLEGIQSINVAGLLDWGVFTAEYLVPTKIALLSKTPSTIEIYNEFLYTTEGECIGVLKDMEAQHIQYQAFKSGNTMCIQINDLYEYVFDISGSFIAEVRMSDYWPTIPTTIDISMLPTMMDMSGSPSMMDMSGSPSMMDISGSVTMDISGSPTTMNISGSPTTMNISGSGTTDDSGSPSIMDMSGLSSMEISGSPSRMNFSASRMDFSDSDMSGSPSRMDFSLEDGLTM